MALYQEEIRFVLLLLKLLSLLYIQALLLVTNTMIRSQQLMRLMALPVSTDQSYQLQCLNKKASGCSTFPVPQLVAGKSKNAN